MWRDREKQKIQREPRRRGTGPVPRRKTLLFATQRCRRVAGSEEKYKLKFGNAQQKVSPEPVIWDRELTGHGSPRRHGLGREHELLGAGSASPPTSFRWETLRRGHRARDIRWRQRGSGGDSVKSGSPGMRFLLSSPGQHQAFGSNAGTAGKLAASDRSKDDEEQSGREQKTVPGLCVLCSRLRRSPSFLFHHRRRCNHLHNWANLTKCQRENLILKTNLRQ